MLIKWFLDSDSFIKSKLFSELELELELEEDEEEDDVVLEPPPLFGETAPFLGDFFGDFFGDNTLVVGGCVERGSLLQSNEENSF